MPKLEVEAYRALAVAAVRGLLLSRGGAVVWPEVEAQLASGSALREVINRAPVSHLDPHHLVHARQVLRDTGEIVEETEILNGRPVAVWITTDITPGVDSTRIARIASHKRKLYRSFLGWTSSETCGDIAERIVAATMERLSGRHLWVDSARRGQVRLIDQQSVPGGPLDHAGHFAIDSTDPTKGFVPIAVEDKNVRSTLYPWSQEVWDLLAKVGAFPDRVPLLVTRRLHSWTYDLFSAIGAVGCQTQNQWFAPTIDEERFRDVTGQLGLHDAVQINDPDAPNRTIANFFVKTLRKPAASAGDQRQLIVRQAERWQKSAPVCAQFIDLRKSQPDHMQRYGQFLEELAEAGVATDRLYNPERDDS